jgi:hypothetical protein
MWLNEQDISSAWGHVKNFMGDAWHAGHKVMNVMDRYANVGLRLFGAAANTGLIRGRALESGIRAAKGYDQIRSNAERFGRDVDKTVGSFRAAVPELNL